MRRQVGSLHCSIFYPANLQSNLPSIPLFAFPPPETPHDNTSSGMDLDTHSNNTVYNTISHFNNSDLKTPDEFVKSEPSPSTFSQPLFQPLHYQLRFEQKYWTKISHELDNFFTLQQQLQHSQTVNIHHLSQSIKSSNPPTPTPSSNNTPSQNPTSLSNPSSSSTN